MSEQCADLECGVPIDPTRDFFVTVNERKGPALNFCSVGHAALYVADGDLSTGNGAPVESEHAAFYEEHYSDWTVHEIPLTVYVPAKDEDRDSSLALVREILNEAAFDIRVSERRRMGP